MNNLIIAVIAVAFTSMLMLAGVNYLSPQHAIVVSTAGQSIDEIEQMAADYNSLTMNLGRRPTVDDYNSVYAGHSQSTVYTAGAGTVSRSASLPDTAGGWVFSQGCGTVNGPNDCFVLNVGANSTVDPKLVFQAAQAAAMKEGNQASRLIYYPGTPGGNYLTGSADPTTWAQQQTYSLVLRLNNGTAGTVTPPSAASCSCNGNSEPSGGPAYTCNVSGTEACSVAAPGYTGTATTITSGTYLCGNGTATAQGTVTVTADTSTCYQIVTDGPGACSNTCGSGTEPINWHCANALGATVSQSLCLGAGLTAPAAQSCSAYTGCTYNVTGTTYAPCSTCGAASSDAVTGWSCMRSDETNMGEDTTHCTAPAAGTCAANYSGCTYNVIGTTYAPCSTCGAASSDAVTGWSCMRSDGTNMGEDTTDCTAPAARTCTANYSGCTYSVTNVVYPPCSTCSAASNVIAASWECLRSDGTNLGENTTDCTAPTPQACAANYSGCTYTWWPLAVTCTPAYGASTMSGTSWECLQTNGALTLSPANYTVVPNSECQGTPTLTAWETIGGGNGGVNTCTSIAACPAACGTDNGFKGPGFTVGGPNACGTGNTYSAAAYDYTDYDWKWTCTNAAGQSTPCSATQVMYGTCGTMNGSSDYYPPWTDSNASKLCGAGSVAGKLGNANETWTWVCTGDNGGTVSPPCTAKQSIYGTCGTAANTCGSGSTVTYGSNTVDFGNYKYDWTCTGDNGGTVATCSAPAPVTCGSDNGGNFANAPWDGNYPATYYHLCNTGGKDTSVGMVSDGWDPYTYTYSWQCQGGPPCSAGLIANGACGSDVNTAYTTYPWYDYNGADPAASGANWNNLCGPGGGYSATQDPAYPSYENTAAHTFNWLCVGPHGGASAECSAPMQASYQWWPQLPWGSCSSTCGTGVSEYNWGCLASYPDNTQAWVGAGDCAGLPQNPAAWIATGGVPPACTDYSQCATCGTTVDTCGAGSVPTGNSGYVDFGTYTYKWTCTETSNGNVSPECTAPAPVTCGSDNGGTFSDVPWDGSNPAEFDHLCNTGGQDTSVGMIATGYDYTNYAWTWTCEGGAPCSARQVMAGTCGTAASTCAGGSVPTGGSGYFDYADDLWKWTCTGLNGGTVSGECSAPAGLTYSWWPLAVPPCNAACGASTLNAAAVTYECLASAGPLTLSPANYTVVSNSDCQTADGAPSLTAWETIGGGNGGVNTCTSDATCLYEWYPTGIGCTPACGASSTYATGWECLEINNGTAVADSLCQAQQGNASLTYWLTSQASNGASATCTDDSQCACGSDNGGDFTEANAPWVGANRAGLCSGDPTGAESGTDNPYPDGAHFSWFCGTDAHPCWANIITVGPDNGGIFSGAPWDPSLGAPSGLCMVGGVPTQAYSGLPLNGAPDFDGDYHWQCAGVPGYSQVYSYWWWPQGTACSTSCGSGSLYGTSWWCSRSDRYNVDCNANPTGCYVCDAVLGAPSLNTWENSPYGNNGGSESCTDNSQCSYHWWPTSTPTCTPACGASTLDPTSSSWECATAAGTVVDNSYCQNALGNPSLAVWEANGGNGGVDTCTDYSACSVGGDNGGHESGSGNGAAPAPAVVVPVTTMLVVMVVIFNL